MKDTWKIEAGGVLMHTIIDKAVNELAPMVIIRRPHCQIIGEAILAESLQERELLVGWGEAVAEG